MAIESSSIGQTAQALWCQPNIASATEPPYASFAAVGSSALCSRKQAKSAMLCSQARCPVCRCFNLSP